MRSASLTAGLLVLAFAALAVAQDRPIVAVFDLEVKGAKLDKGTADRLTDYLGTLLARQGFLVVPRSQLKDRLVESKKGSYKVCYDQSCQIEVGKELAAQKSLASQVLKIGSRCMVTLSLFDLRRSASEGAGTFSGECSEDGVVESLQKALDDLLANQQVVPAPIPVVPSVQCADGLEVSADTQGHCCWKGQAWNGTRCVGKPAHCPLGLLALESGCTAPPCALGQVRLEGGTCCWPGQGWSSSQERCIGTPDCPNDLIAQGETCVPYPFIGQVLKQAEGWKTELKITCIKSDRACGQVDFRDLNCGGKLFFQEPFDGGFLFREQLDYGGCVRGCSIWVNEQGTEFREYCDSRVTGSGQLTKSQW